MRLVKYSEVDKHLYFQLIFNEETMKMNLGRVFTREEAEAFFEAVLEINASETGIGFYKVFTCHEGSDTYIGMGVINQNEEHGALEIEYMLLPQYWNCGYGTKLAETLVQAARHIQNSPRIVAITDSANRYSKRILCKIGFEFVQQYLNDDREPAELYQFNRAK